MASAQIAEEVAKTTTASECFGAPRRAVVGVMGAGVGREYHAAVVSHAD